MMDRVNAVTFQKHSSPSQEDVAQFLTDALNVKDSQQTAELKSLVYDRPMET
jgi:hypothetical protein